MFFTPLGRVGDVLVRCRPLLRSSGGHRRLESGTPNEVDGGTFFFGAAQGRDLTGAAHAGLGKASGSLKATEPHVFHTIRPSRGRRCPVQALTEVVRGPLSTRKWYTKKGGWWQIFFDAPEVRDMTGAAHAGLGKASGSLPTKEAHAFHTLRPCRGRPCPVQALTEVVWGPRSVRKRYTKESGWWHFFRCSTSS